MTISARVRSGSRIVACALVTLTSSALSARLPADEVHVMVSGGFTAAGKILFAEWEQATANTVTTAYGASMGATPAAIPNRLARGEAADVVIMARGSLDALAAAGTVAAGSQVDLARSRIGMAVRAGTTKPDISTESAFRQALLDAPSIAYSDSASGVYLSSVLFKRLGIAAQMAPKGKMIPGRPVGEVVAAGEAAIGFQQISELLPIQGITLVGPIPDADQLVTTFSAGLTPAATPAARRLVAYLASAAAAKTIRGTGLDPVAGTPASSRFSVLAAAASVSRRP